MIDAAQIWVPDPYILWSGGHLHEMLHSAQNCMYHLPVTPLWHLHSLPPIFFISVNGITGHPVKPGSYLDIESKNSNNPNIPDT